MKDKEVKDAIWDLYNKAIDNEINPSTTLALIITTAMEIGMIGKLNPQYLLIAQMLVMGFSKQETLAIVEEMFAVKKKRMEAN